MPALLTGLAALLAVCAGALLAPERCAAALSHILLTLLATGARTASPARLLAGIAALLVLLPLLTGIGAAPLLAAAGILGLCVGIGLLLLLAGLIAGRALLATQIVVLVVHFYSPSPLEQAAMKKRARDDKLPDSGKKSVIVRYQKWIVIQVRNLPRRRSITKQQGGGPLVDAVGRVRRPQQRGFRS